MAITATPTGAIDLSPINSTNRVASAGDWSSCKRWPDDYGGRSAGMHPNRSAATSRNWSRPGDCGLVMPRPRRCALYPLDVSSSGADHPAAGHLAAILRPHRRQAGFVGDEVQTAWAVLAGAFLRFEHRCNCRRCAQTIGKRAPFGRGCHHPRHMREFEPTGSSFLDPSAGPHCRVCGGREVCCRSSRREPSKENAQGAGRAAESRLNALQQQVRLCGRCCVHGTVVGELINSRRTQANGKFAPMSRNRMPRSPHPDGSERPRDKYS